MVDILYFFYYNDKVLRVEAKICISFAIIKIVAGRKKWNTIYQKKQKAVAWKQRK